VLNFSMIQVYRILRILVMDLNEFTNLAPPTVGFASFSLLYSVPKEILL